MVQHHTCKKLTTLAGGDGGYRVDESCARVEELMQQGLRLGLQPLFGLGCLNRNPVQQLPHVLRTRTASCSRSIHQRFATGG